MPNGARAGLFVLDGADVDEVILFAGLIWENWQNGRIKPCKFYIAIFVYL